MSISVTPSPTTNSGDEKPGLKRVQPTLDTVTSIQADGSRRFIHPATAKGRFTTLRGLAGVVLMLVYVILPWVKVGAGPAVFLDVANRQFHFFGLTFVAQDLWLAFFFITGLGFSLFYVTSLLGRVWCGWACPQTVFLDIIRRVERLIEGDAADRRQLDASPLTGSKTLKRVVKHTIFAIFALILAHVFLSYFVSLPKVYAMMGQAPGENWGAFVFVFLTAGALWFDFAWFREQFCIVLCPYGRLQSALTDPDTVVIGYDAKRGEPRGKKGTPGAADCVDCRKCVQVCPTGIDIRQGLQMECIGCAACVDACDDVMTKLQRPVGLIRYDSQRGFEGKKTRWIRPRIILYTGLMLLGAIVMSFALSTLKPANVSITRMTGAPYFVEGETVRNQFLVRILNKHTSSETFHVTLVESVPGLQIAGAENGIVVGSLGESLTPLVITGPKQKLLGEKPLSLDFSTADGSVTIRKNLTFIGPDL